MAKEKTTKKERLKTFVKNNKKKLIVAGLLVIAGVYYCFTETELDIDKLANVVCSWVGGC